MKSKIILLNTLLLLICLTARLFGGEPILISSTGVPFKWDTTSPILFRTDGGNLGALSNAEAVAIAVDAFQVWADVQMANLSFTNSGQITDNQGNPIDVTLQNFANITNNGQNEVVFDESGEIFDSLFGPNSGIIGFAGPGVFTTGAPFLISEGRAVLNGDFVSNAGDLGVTLPQMRAVLVHELGHFLNLAHNQVNGLAFNSQEDIQGFGPPPRTSIETMFPFIIDSSQVSLHLDDIATLLSIYSGSSGTGTITGKVFLKDGITPVNGVNVIARNNSGGATTIFDDAVSQISGAFSLHNGDGSSDPGFQGLYTLSSLTPGGDYSIEIDEIGDGGFSSETLTPLPGPEEFYNGSNESSDPDVDDKNEITFVNPIANSTVGNIDIIFNDELPAIVLDKYDDSIETILTIRSPAGPNDFFAVRHSVPASVDTPFIIESIRYFNNDAQTTWPQVIVAPPNASDQPDLANPLAVFPNQTGPTLGFLNISSNLQLNTFDDFFVVIQFPPGESLTAVGFGGGPGIGTDSNLDLGFIEGNLASGDGVNFVELDDQNLAIEVTLSGKQRSDANEPNDNMAAATPFSFGPTVSGYIEPLNDMDYFIFTGDQDDFIEVTLAGQTLGSGIDGFLTLADNTGQPLANADDQEPGTNFDALLRASLPATGTYFIIVEDARGAGGGSLFYEMSMEKVTTTSRLTHSTGQVNFEVWSNGVYGDDGGGAGGGFSFMGSPGGTLFSGGFLAATPTKIAANIPSLVDQAGQPTLIDFEEVLPFTPFASDNNFNQIANCQFDEGMSNAANSPIGIVVTQNSFSNLNDKFVLVECEVSNNTSATITDLYLGQFGDWDVGLSNFNQNRGGFDSQRNLVYQFEFGSNPNDSNYYGMKALQTATGARVTNFLGTTNSSIGDSLFAFLSNLNGPGPIAITSNNEYRSFIGSGPFTLEPNASMTAGFAWVGGTDLADLQANAGVAQAAWDNLVVSVEEIASSIVPQKFALEQNYPNPFNPSTNIKYALAENSHVSLIIYNMLGQAVRTLVDGRQIPNLYEVEWDGRNDAGTLMSSGVFFYSLKAGKELKVRKMLFLK